MKNLEEYKEKINIAIKRFLEEKLKKDGKYDPYIKELIEKIIEYNMRGGKRIRPLTIIFTYKCFKDDEKIVDASICIELMQSYFLIHDDIIDKGDLRRGKPAMHKIYGFKNKDFGISMAILAGNLCANYVFDSILESSFNDNEKIEAIKHLVWTINRENFGEAIDILSGIEELKEEDIWKIYELKTATYTMQGPIYIGAVLANAPEDKIKKLQEYAYNVGVAFQIQDDINGVFGEIEETGKPNDSDVKEGKKTLPIVKTLELCKKNEREFIFKEYGNKDIENKDIEKIREIMKKCGAYDYCKNKLNEMIEKGKKSIADVELREEGKKFLLELADYIKGLC